jgi:hypothetical protein
MKCVRVDDRIIKPACCSSSPREAPNESHSNADDPAKEAERKKAPCEDSEAKEEGKEDCLIAAPQSASRITKLAGMA